MRHTLIPVALAACLALASCAEEMEETPPQQIATSPFHYPEELWDAQVEGETVLRLYVNPEGLVDSVQVDRGSGYAAFDSAAVRGVVDLRFDPARRGDDPVGAWILLPVRFEQPRDAGGDGGSTDSLPSGDL
jgi:periplasmic protein TonB